ncbi:unnamed protein product [Urochloa humidicola]
MAMLKRGLLLSLLYLFSVPRSTSLSFHYNFTAPGATVLTGADIDITYVSDAAAGRDRIELTKDTTWSTGKIVHGQPVRLWDNSTGKVASFTSNFTFAIKPRNDTPQGDGMAFFLLPYTPSVPQDCDAGFLGVFTNPRNPANSYFPPAVAVEFDTFKNEWDPNNTVNHIGVDVNNISSVAYTALPDGCFNQTMSAWIRYDANASTLSATLRLDDHLPGQGRLYNVTATVDFKEAGLPEDAAVGLSATTGDFVEGHQILSWSFQSTLTTSVAAVPDARRHGSPSSTRVFESKTSKTKGIRLIAAPASAGMVMLLMVAAWLGYREYVKRKMPEEPKDAGTPPVDGDMDDEFEKGTGPRKFSYSQLSQATCGFSDDKKLGEGGFGSVYRGFLQDQELHVAIKRVSKTSRQGRREYISEVTIISRLRHRNLVQLVGWCHEADELLLVYELMTNGSLDTHLYGARNILTWPIRYKIILGMGSALLYLHQEWEQCVVHRDIKPSNVMLDSSSTVKLGDFGLARLIDHSRGAHTTMLAGTMGYMDPECLFTGRASPPSDIYSLGIVLLEMVCGRKPILPHEDDKSKVQLVQWVWAMYGRGMLLDAADTRLLVDSEFNAQEMERALLVGLWCVHPDYEFRPSIRQAMNVLQFEAKLPELPLEMPVPTYGPPVAGPPGVTGQAATCRSPGVPGSTRALVDICDRPAN